MVIRKMTEADLDQVTAVEEACFSRPWSRQGFLDSMRSDEGIFLVAESLDTVPHVMGYIGMIASIDEGEITNVAVAAKSRRLGVGEALLNAVRQEATRRGLVRIVLEVRVSNAPAIGLYEKMGFSSLGIRRNFYDFPREDALIMALEEIC